MKPGQGQEWGGKVLTFSKERCRVPDGLSSYAVLLDTFQNHRGPQNHYSEISIVILSWKLRDFMLLKHSSGWDLERHYFHQQSTPSISISTSHRLREGWGKRQPRSPQSWLTTVAVSQESHTLKVDSWGANLTDFCNRSLPSKLIVLSPMTYRPRGKGRSASCFSKLYLNLYKHMILSKTQ